MRRKDRQVTDLQKIRGIIADCDCCRVGFNDDGQVYIVPMNFGIEWQDDTPVFYFHGATEGRKNDIVKVNPSVGFELDTGAALIESDAACGHSARYQSIIGNGEMHCITDPQEKEKGLRLIMEHYTGKRDWAFSQQMLSAVTVFRLTATTFSCKEHL